MAFINAGAVMSVLDMYRIIWISGRFGGHKTSLAFKIFDQFYGPRGYRLISNAVSVWTEPELKNVLPDDDGHLKAFVLFDEGGLYFNTSQQVKQIAAYAAKMDCTYVIPSYWPPTRAAQIINIQPVISLKAAGIPCIIYQWKVDCGGMHDKGHFVWWKPQEIYGIYSRQNPGAEPEEIIDWLVDQTDSYRKRFGYKKRNNFMETMDIKPEDVYMDAADEISAAADRFASVSQGKHRKR
jgi:hypothetical protein